MMLSSICRLAGVSSPSSRFKFVLAVARPAAGVWSGNLSGTRLLSTRPKKDQRDESLLYESFSDALDESDSIETGKKSAKITPANTNKDSSNGRRFAKQVLRHHLGNRHPSLWSSFMSTGFDDDFFAHDDPFFDSLFLDRHRLQFRDLFFLDPFRRSNFRPVLDGSLRSIKEAGDTTVLRSSLGYKIKESESAYEIDINVPDGISAADIKLELLQDGTVLQVSGEHKVEREHQAVHARFNNHFSVGPNIDIDNLSANLSEGVLVVNAPKIVMDTEEKTKRTIPITENQKSDEQVKQSNYNDEFDESDWAETGKESSKVAKSL